MIGGTIKKPGIAIGIAIAGLAFGGATSSASAADLSGGGFADLEERIAELEATTARKGNRKVSLTVSGFLNEALLFWDDGQESNAYVITNEEAQSRVRFLGEAEIAKGWKAGYLLEIGIRGARGDRVDQDTPDGVAPSSGSDAISTRHSAWWLSSKDYGKLWLGLTSDAADGITEINLANTNHFASSNKQYSGDGGSGFFIRNSTTGSNIPIVPGTALKWGNVSSPPGAAQQIGEGHRENLVKYETPTFAGFTGSASWGEDDIWNLALRYKGEFSGFKFAAGVAYSEINKNNQNTWRRGAGDTDELGLSASLLHTETGLYVTGAYGRLTDDGIGAGLDDESNFYFVQAGIERKFFPVGKTTLFGEYWQTDRGAWGVPLAGGGGTVISIGGDDVTGSTYEGWGLGVNQNFSEVFDLYLLYNHTTADISTTGGKLTGIEDEFDYVVGGAQIKF
jgi:predicted porin